MPSIIDAILTLNEGMTDEERGHVDNFDKCIKIVKATKEENTARANKLKKRFKDIDAEIEKLDTSSPEGQVDTSFIRSHRDGNWREKLNRKYGARCAIKGTKEATQGCHIIDLKTPQEDLAAIWANPRIKSLNDLGNGIVLDTSIHHLFDADQILIRPNGEMWMRKSDTLDESTLATIRSHLSPDNNEPPPRVKLSETQKWCLEKRNLLRLNKLKKCEHKKWEYSLRRAALHGEVVKEGYVRIEMSEPPK